MGGDPCARMAHQHHRPELLVCNRHHGEAQARADQPCREHVDGVPPRLEQRVHVGPSAIDAYRPPAHRIGLLLPGTAGSPSSTPAALTACHRDLTAAEPPKGMRRRRRAAGRHSAAAARRIACAQERRERARGGEACRPSSPAVPRAATAGGGGRAGGGVVGSGPATPLAAQRGPSWQGGRQAAGGFGGCRVRMPMQPGSRARKWSGVKQWF
jgi:hypothetical protein